MHSSMPSRFSDRIIIPELRSASLLAGHAVDHPCRWSRGSTRWAACETWRCDAMNCAASIPCGDLLASRGAESHRSDLFDDRLPIRHISGRGVQRQGPGPTWFCQQGRPVSEAQPAKQLKTGPSPQLLLTSSAVCEATNQIAYALVGRSLADRCSWQWNGQGPEMNLKTLPRNASWFGQRR